MGLPKFLFRREVNSFPTGLIQKGQEKNKQNEEAFWFQAWVILVLNKHKKKSEKKKIKVIKKKEGGKKNFQREKNRLHRKDQE